MEEDEGQPPTITVQQGAAEPPPGGAGGRRKSRSRSRKSSVSPQDIAKVNAGNDQCKLMYFSYVVHMYWRDVTCT